MLDIPHRAAVPTLRCPSSSECHTAGPCRMTPAVPPPQLLDPRGWILLTKLKLAFPHVGDKVWHLATHVKSITLTLTACHWRTCL